MVDSKITCPVCNADKTGDSTACPICGFEGAFYTLFSGEKAYNIWKSLADARRIKVIGDAYIKRREQGSELLVTSDRVCFFDADKSKAVIVEFNKNEPQVLENVKQVSLSGLFRVWLNKNGTIGSSGDDESGQRHLNSLIEIINVATTSKCTYAVRADGTVTSRGAGPFKEEIKTWTDIKAISGAEQHIIGLKNDKTVVYAVQEGALFGGYASAMNRWRSVKKVATADYYAMALCEDGTVLYAGADNGKAQCKNWKNIIDIAADGQYAIGLTCDGDVLLAGDSSSLIDFGRGEAANWKDMVFIAAGRSLIAGISKSGELKVVGNIISNDIIAPKFSNAMQLISTKS